MSFISSCLDLCLCYDKCEDSCGNLIEGTVRGSCDMGAAVKRFNGTLGDLIEMFGFWVNLICYKNKYFLVNGLIALSAALSAASAIWQ